ncbi:carbon-nitrogen hydrolase family protein [Streptomyces sp. Alain-F2R5]|jgi:N-carbamoylputrescine amidase|nr:MULTISPECIES: carbon-nitrogen hydrolase family protein [unclassified Streptomyces]MDG9694789.1 carbon-nitrogen hydrolase family protein [Streptomyces sp. DH17]OSC71382.1 carbon-nitrogen hydrolase family protein [Streptomyces sp. 4F]PAN02980.1 carbon-nitrogen hydrolase family protein [Streptomyces sp. Alain-F2R5]MDN3244723.1 carbon-nitrogen hydrolase family protein [Streptomyces sp. ZSW22]MDN3252703.1 carbon-nitrogen hydrolase family protein [Streptomyces sp. MA25(2023)]
MPGMKIAVVQMESKLGKPAQNLRRAEHYIREAAGQGANLICLPEAFSTSGNILEVADVSVPVPGPETEFLCEQAKQADAYLVAGLLERGDDGKYYSTSVLCGPDGTMLGRYRRVHCHELEARYLTGGTEYPVFDVEFGRIGLMQGYDVNFPEVAREYCRRGVDVIVCSALVPEMFAYVANMRLPVRAVDAECVVAFASGIGTNLFAGFGYMGRSQILADPLFLEAERFDFVDGDERMVDLGTEPGVGVVEVDLDRMRRYRAKATLSGDLKPATYWQLERE